MKLSPFLTNAVVNSPPCVPITEFITLYYKYLFTCPLTALKWKLLKDLNRTFLIFISQHPIQCLKVCIQLIRAWPLTVMRTSLDGESEATSSGLIVVLDPFYLHTTQIVRQLQRWVAVWDSSIGSCGCVFRGWLFCFVSLCIVFDGVGVVYCFWWSRRTQWEK